MARKIYINKPMLEALEKMLRITECPVCGQEIGYHGWITLKSDGSEIIHCSNAGKKLT